MLSPPPARTSRRQFPEEARFFTIQAGCLLFWSCVGDALCLLLGSSFNRFLCHR